MARAKPGFQTIRRPAQFTPHNDPMIRAANSKKEAERFQAMMRRTREAAGHDEEAMKQGKCRCGYCGGKHG
jgi:hypothetical protein